MSSRVVRRIPGLRLAAWAACAAALPAAVAADAAPTPSPSANLPYYLRDRGEGLSTSLFGTYVRRHELLVYTFYEYELNHDEEYKPSELGFGGPESDDDHLGKSVTHEALVFVAYGVSDWLALEIEPALWTTSTLTKADDDPSNQPQEIRESGLGDVDMQVRWRYFQENERRPELFSFFEYTPPLQRNRKIIGTQDAEYSFGTGLTKGFRWGTLTGRASFFYSSAEGAEFSEYAVEYLKRASDRWRFVAAVEGEQEDVQAIVEVQIHVNPRCFIKLNSGFGITPKAPDFAPEVGVLFSF